MKKNLNRILLLIVIFATIGTTPLFAQTKSRKKAKTHKVHKKVKSRATSTSSDTYNGRTIHTGPRGGRYYINRNGNKTYI
ncbi:hypothetical protein [Halpernia frigidisoli]|uniref:Colicin import membrane protein n=1 Tax=Halpernia frigidisoli TaxID=1125876 RepID=A0A1I3HHQ8_9FLAO|nr:hypothetical protein [Halpernia frigidisoli]SFI35097.1 colicin import membrane protein [Halpernia frigidisoli]